MKRLLSAFLLSIFTALYALAQQPIYLFPEFKPAEVVFHGYSPEKVNVNIDAAGQRILYQRGGKVYEMTNAYALESMAVNGQTFVMKNGLLCERLSWEKDTVYVNWRFKKVNTGSVGAMGAATQNKVDVLWTNTVSGTPVEGEGRYYAMGEYSREIWERKGDNTYIFRIGDTEYTAKRLKDLYKAFPEQKEALKAYVKEKKYTMENAQEALNVISYLRGLVQ